MEMIKQKNNKSTSKNQNVKTSKHKPANKRIPTTFKIIKIMFSSRHKECPPKKEGI